MKPLNPPKVYIFAFLLFVTSSNICEVMISCPHSADHVLGLYERYHLLSTETSICTFPTRFPGAYLLSAQGHNQGAIFSLIFSIMSFLEDV